MRPKYSCVCNLITDQRQKHAKCQRRKANMLGLAADNPECQDKAFLTDLATKKEKLRILNKKPD